MFYYNEYDFREDKNYLIYFRGNFGPPTRGHFSLVEKYCHHKNVKYLISQIGGKRHGVSFQLNEKIWKIYIRDLLPKERIKLIKMDTSLEVLEHIKDIDIVIFLRGNEEKGEEKKKYKEEGNEKYKEEGNEKYKEERNEKYKGEGNEKERDSLNRYSPLIRKLKKRKIPLHFLTIDRPEINTLSTTKFIESIIEKRSLRTIKFFLPNLSEEKIIYIVRKLRKENLKI